MRRSLLGVAISLAFGGAADAADPPARCEVRVIHALKEGAGIDTRITRLRPFLEKEPFSAWKQFKLLDTQDLTLAGNATQSFALPNGKQGSLTYLDHVLRADGKHRLRMQLGIGDGSKKALHTTFVLDEGGVVLQAGQHYQNGLLILGVSCETDTKR